MEGQTLQAEGEIAPDLHTSLPTAGSCPGTALNSTSQGFLPPGDLIAIQEHRLSGVQLLALASRLSRCGWSLAFSAAAPKEAGGVGSSDALSGGVAILSRRHLCVSPLFCPVGGTGPPPIAAARFVAVRMAIKGVQIALFPSTLSLVTAWVLPTSHFCVTSALRSKGLASPLLLPVIGK